MAKSNMGSQKKSRKIYLDYASSATPNPGSIHEVGVEAKQKLQNARKNVADLLGSRGEEIIFTSGGTESNNLAIQGVVLSARENNFLLPHIITTNIEHPSVLDTCKMLKRRKLATISIIPVEQNGIVNPLKIKKELKKNTVLVSVMYANNEIGTIQPIKEIGKIIRHFRKRKQGENFSQDFLLRNVNRSKSFPPVFSYPVFHTDAVQAVNYLNLNVEKLGVDLLSLSGSKIEGAGRVGVLYRKKNLLLQMLYGGGDQEFGLRPGTENLPEILKFSDAFSATRKIYEKESKRLTTLQNYFINKIPSLIRANGSIEINGDVKNRLPNNVNITIPKIPSDLLVIELSAKGVMVSSKSACKSSRAEGSYVIEALRPNSDPEIGGLRFSFGRQTNKKDIDYTVQALKNILIKLKKWYN